MLGGLSAMYELRYPGIVFQSVALTLATMLAMLVLYRTGAIRAGGRYGAGTFPFLSPRGLPERAGPLIYLVAISVRTLPRMAR